MTDLKDWRGCADPTLEMIEGRLVHIEPAQFPGDEDALFEAIGGPGNDDLWRHIPLGPFETAADLGAAMKRANEEHGWRTHLIRVADGGRMLGMASYMRIRSGAGSVEVGCIVFSKALQRTPAASEAMYLMARHIFETHGYRRYEWKCDNANEASKRAALRYGFSFEGVFRQDLVVKGRNRDTAWFSMLDSEWPEAKAAFEAWLAPNNFDDAGVQRRSLASFRDAS